MHASFLHLHCNGNKYLGMRKKGIYFSQAAVDEVLIITLPFGPVVIKQNIRKYHVLHSCNICKYLMPITQHKSKVFCPIAEMGTFQQT